MKYYIQMKLHLMVEKKHAKKILSYSHDFINNYTHVIISSCLHLLLLLLCKNWKKQNNLLSY